MAYCLGVGAHIVACCSSFDNPLYLLMLVRLDEYVIATLLQDIEPEVWVTQA